MFAFSVRVSGFCAKQVEILINYVKQKKGQYMKTNLNRNTAYTIILKTRRNCSNVFKSKVALEDIKVKDAIGIV